MKDRILLLVIFLSVFVSLPVSSMGNKNLFTYLFNGEKVTIVPVTRNCLGDNSLCSVELGNGVSMKIAMKSLVSSTEPFSIKVKFLNDEVNKVDVLFKGVEHSHGLRKQSLSEISSQNFGYTGQLGYCGSGVMSWLAIFDVSSNGTVYKVSLPFKSVDPKFEGLEYAQTQTTDNILASKSIISH